MDVQLLLTLLPLTWILYNAYCLYQDWQESSCLGISTICVPVSPDNPVWIASDDVRTLAINMLAFARLQKSYPFKNSQ